MGFGEGLAFDVDKNYLVGKNDFCSGRIFLFWTKNTRSRCDVFANVTMDTNMLTLSQNMFTPRVKSSAQSLSFFFVFSASSSPLFLLVCYISKQATRHGSPKCFNLIFSLLCLMPQMLVLFVLVPFWSMYIQYSLVMLNSEVIIYPLLFQYRCLYRIGKTDT